MKLTEKELELLEEYLSDSDMTLSVIVFHAKNDLQDIFNNSLESLKFHSIKKEFNTKIYRLEKLYNDLNESSMAEYLRKYDIETQDFIDKLRFLETDFYIPNAEDDRIGYYPFKIYLTYEKDSILLNAEFRNLSYFDAMIWLDSKIFNAGIRSTEKGKKLDFGTPISICNGSTPYDVMTAYAAFKLI